MKPFNLGLVMVMSAAISIVTPGTVQARQSTQATSVLSSLSPPPLTPGQMQAEIQPFCAHIDLDIALLLRAVLAKDEALSPLQLQERLNKGWQASFDAHWQENAFDTVFHSYFYRYALSRHHVLSPAQQAQLKHLRQDFEQTLAGMRVPAITPTYHPMFEPTSAITPDYTFSFKAQPQVPGYTWLYRSSAKTPPVNWQPQESGDDTTRSKRTIQHKLRISTLNRPLRRWSKSCCFYSNSIY